MRLRNVHLLLFCLLSVSKSQCCNESLSSHIMSRVMSRVIQGSSHKSSRVISVSDRVESAASLEFGYRFMFRCLLVRVSG